MSGLVKRLRADERYGDLDLYHEAADEIERLLEENARLRDHVDRLGAKNRTLHNRLRAERDR